LPNGTRESIVIRCGINILILEPGSNQRALLRLITISQDLRAIDVEAVGAVEIELDVNAGWKVELAVQRAGTVSRRDRICG